MAKKTLKKKISKKSAKAVNPVIRSAREIALAGMGAMALAQKESGKVIEQGSKLFERLVKEGEKMESKTKNAASGAVVDLREEVENRFGSVKQQASENWDKLEKVFEDRVARTLGRLGVPTADDVQELIERVQVLAEKVKEAAQKSVKKETKPVRKAAKSAAKKTSKVAKTTKTRASKATKKASASVKNAVKEVKAKTA